MEEFKNLQELIDLIKKLKAEGVEAKLNFNVAVSLLEAIEPSPEPEPEPGATIKVFVDADKALLWEEHGENEEGLPIMQIWHDKYGNVARFDRGTLFTVLAKSVLADGGNKMWKLYYHPEFYLNGKDVQKSE